MMFAKTQIKIIFQRYYDVDDDIPHDFVKKKNTKIDRNVFNRLNKNCLVFYASVSKFD